MSEKKKSKMPFIIIGLVLMISASIGIYIYLKNKNIEFPVKSFIIYLVILLSAVGLVGFLIWWIPSLFKKKNEQFLESPKEIVSSSRAIEIWKEEFIKYNDIPYITQTWNKNKIQCVNDRAVEIRHDRSFVDPSGQTSDKFITFQANILEGRRIGTMVVVLRVDLGEEWIKQNWNWRIDDNTTMNRFNMQIKKFPLTSAKDSAERYNIKKLELLEEGYTKDEIKEMIDPFIPVRSATPEPQPQKKESKAPIRSPDVSDIYPDQESDDDSADQSDLDEDIENYRKKNA